jgi:ATP-dependent exoDNAse (exonuclease V) beta subunit
MLDEAQDSSPCVLDIVLRQRRCGVILVGDRHQAIYGMFNK